MRRSKVKPWLAPPVTTNPGVAPMRLATLFGGGADPTNFQLEAPNDSDTADYGTKNYYTATTIPPLSNIATIQRSSATRLGPTVEDGVPATIHRVVSTDPLRNGGQRSEMTYSTCANIIAAGVDYWLGIAIKWTADWDDTGGLGSDGQSFFQLHQNGGTNNPFGFVLTYHAEGDGRRGLSWRGAEYASGGGTVRRRLTINSLPTTGVWYRFITHLRMGDVADSPIMEGWYAVGTGDYTKVTTGYDNIAATAPWGDSDDRSTNYFKHGIYKYGSAWGTSTDRTMYMSGLYLGQGAYLFNEAAAAISAYAR